MSVYGARKQFPKNLSGVIVFNELGQTIRAVQMSDEVWLIGRSVDASKRICLWQQGF